MQSLRPLYPILTAAGILLAGNGLQGTLIALRGAQEGFSPFLIGFMGASYFAGFFFGCMVITHMLRAVGHIRVFAALAAIAASMTLMLVLVVDPVVWIVLRFIVGFCFSGLFTVMESWINSGIGNEGRARALAVYRIIDLGSVTLSQFMIPLFGTDGFVIFGVMAIMITLSLVPVSLGDRSNPQPPSEVALDVWGVWRLSPVACAASLVAGLTNSAFRLVGPIYAQGIGLSVSDVAIFISLGVIGGVALQYPLGSLSDRWDRRMVLLISSGCAMVTGIVIALFAGSDRIANFVLVTIFAAFALPLYSLAAAHANDNAGKGEFVKIAAVLMFFYSIGAVIGPLASSLLMEQYGLSALFVFSSAVYAIFVAMTAYRMRIRGPVPKSQRGRFTALLRTSPVFARLAQRASERKNGDGER
ncbi:MFS transporter [Aquamicrobium sp. LC103]|uniref:MFS transporter n=1 Tax=Aquamicrobium sp. LC103 TaxID=1120658 RepID=UPI00063E789F|nr:MFS transporter [Aquamicrobium sp. LC103]TKT81400.1 MFS transporter [Aquamicrobium sp. LC103]